MSKKVCMHSDVYFRTNRQTGKVTTGKLCYPSTKEPSAAQTTAKARFAKVAAAIRTLLTDPTEKAKLLAEYKAQHKVGSLFGYAMKKLNLPVSSIVHFGLILEPRFTPAPQQLSTLN